MALPVFLREMLDQDANRTRAGRAQQAEQARLAEQERLAEQDRKKEQERQLEQARLDALLEACRSHPKTDGIPVYSGPGVYFLLKEGKIVYVGKAVNVAQRIGSHTGRKDFDSFTFFKCSSPDMDWLEVQVIKELEPPLNVACIPGRRPKQVYSKEMMITDRNHPNGILLKDMPPDERKYYQDYIDAGGLKPRRRK